MRSFRGWGSGEDSGRRRLSRKSVLGFRLSAAQVLTGRPRRCPAEGCSATANSLSERVVMSHWLDSLYFPCFPKDFTQAGLRALAIAGYHRKLSPAD